MALKQEHRTKPNARVRIKDSVTHMYPHARAYSEGTVKHQTHDHLGYPLVFVEWDRDHWAYSGEEDRWALEAHFDLVESKMAEDKNRTDELVQLFAEFLASRDKSTQNPEPAPAPEDPRPDRDLTYEEVLEKAVEAAKAGDAYVVIVAKPETFNGTEIVVPYAYMHQKSDDAGLLCNTTMADLVAQAYGRLADQVVERSRRENGPSGS